MNASDRLVVALDRSGRDDILRLAEALQGVAGVYKIGLQAFIANGPSIVRELVTAGQRVFLDLKLHDIPNTASHAAVEGARLGASIMTIHAAGGRSMMAACSAALPTPRPLLLGVTILTSLAAADLEEVGIRGGPLTNAVALARLAQSSGLDGVVASPLEIDAIREACGDSFVILTPGIRAAADASGDQQRTMTAKEAVSRGATYIVVGRPITGAADPRAAAEAIVAEIDSTR